MQLSPVGYSAYLAAKAAVKSLSQTLSVELASRGIRTNCLIGECTGAVPINWNGLGALNGETAQPGIKQPSDVGAEFANDIADAAVFLASSLSRGITGQEIVVGKQSADD